MQDKKRLRLIAKELNVSIQTIIDFLELNNQKIPKDQNQLIEKETYTLLKLEFYESYVNHCLHHINFNKELFIYSFNPNFSFTEDEIIHNKKDFEAYNYLLLQLESISKINFPYKDLDRSELNLLKQTKIFELKKIQFNLIQERNNIDKLATIEVNTPKIDANIEDEEHELNNDDTDHETIIMRSFYEGTQDNFGY
ncbi:MAG: hypothetical protein H6589_00835 [Flavobacteriales bacterium]|nr:hypothetical protein [Flavobacteriales bacterium]